MQFRGGPMKRIHYLLIILFLSIFAYIAQADELVNGVEQVKTEQGNIVIGPSEVSLGTTAPEKATIVRVEEINHQPIDPEEVNGQVFSIGDGTAVIVR